MKKFGLCLIIMYIFITTGCGPTLMNTKFNEKYLPNAQPGKPLVSLDIPKEISEKHKADYRTLFGNQKTIYSCYTYRIRTAKVKKFGKFLTMR